jgi:hypothetical protein
MEKLLKISMFCLVVSLLCAACGDGGGPNPNKNLAICISRYREALESCNKEDAQAYAADTSCTKKSYEIFAAAMKACTFSTNEKKWVSCIDGAKSTYEESLKQCQATYEPSMEALKECNKTAADSLAKCFESGSN